MSVATAPLRDFPRLRTAWNTLWPLAKRYWFDALIVAGVGVSIAVAVVDQGKEPGPDGPLWFDVLAAVATIVPLFARRRHPFGAPAAVFVLIAATSFVDPGFIGLIRISVE